MKLFDLNKYIEWKEKSRFKYEAGCDRDLPYCLPGKAAEAVL